MLLLIFALVALVLFVRHLCYRKVQFLSKKEAITYLETHHHVYLNSLSPEERRLKGLPTRGTARELAEHAVRDLTYQEKATLRACTPFDQLAIPWIFIGASPSFEYGFPHTVAGAIVIASTHNTPNLKRTLRHERVHVAQKLFPEWFAAYYKRTYQMERIPRLRIPYEVARQRRSNPDTQDADYGFVVNNHSKCQVVVPLCIYKRRLPDISNMSEVVEVGLCLPTLDIYPLAQLVNDGLWNSRWKGEHIHEIVAYAWESEFPKDANSLKRYIRSKMRIPNPRSFKPGADRTTG